jgi:hypothetical protein
VPPGANTPFPVAAAQRADDLDGVALVVCPNDGPRRAKAGLDDS